jgi:hypothetical protein
MKCLIGLLLTAHIAIGAHAISKDTAYGTYDYEYQQFTTDQTPSRQTSLFSNIGSPSIIMSSNLPITISSPGRYILVEHASYNASGAGSAITINSSNVILDLLNFNLSQQGGIASVNGISVASGLTNIVIKNGCIKDFSHVGVSVGSGCSQVVCSGLTFGNCGNRCLELVGSSASPIQIGTVKDCTFLASCTLTTADNVVTLSHCLDFELEHCNIHNNGSTAASGSLAMININNSHRCKISTVETHNNIGNTDLRGISLKQSHFNVFKNCMISTHLAWGNNSAAYGIILEGNSTSTANIFLECATANLTGTVVDGFLSSTNCDDNNFICCKSLSHKANSTSGIVHGFRCITNSRNQFIECIASHNTAPSSTVASPFHGAYGFKIDTTTGTYVRKCIANDNTASARATGFFFGATDQCVAEENSSCRNTTWGFDVNNLTFNDQVFIKNFALKNNIAGGPGSSQYSGFGANAANDSFTASNFGSNTGGLTGQPGPISWVNLGIG